MELWKCNFEIFVSDIGGLAKMGRYWRLSKDGRRIEFEFDKIIILISDIKNKIEELDTVRTL